MLSNLEERRRHSTRFESVTKRTAVLIVLARKIRRSSDIPFIYLSLSRECCSALLLNSLVYVGGVSDVLDLGAFAVFCLTQMKTKL